MNILLAAFVMLLAVVLPLTAIYIRAKHGKTGKAPLVADLCSFFGVIAVLTVVFFTQSASAASTTTAAATTGYNHDTGITRSRDHELTVIRERIDAVAVDFAHSSTRCHKLGRCRRSPR